MSGSRATPGTERLPMFLRRRPPEQALAWVCASIGDGAQIAGLRRLRGGSSSAMYAIDVLDRAGTRHRLVLRRLVREDWLAEEPDVAEREARVLRLLEGSAVVAPRLVAFDADGSRCDVPAVLMTRLPGHADLAAADLDAYLSQLAEALPPVFDVPLGDPPPVRPSAAFNDIAAREVPRWSREPEAWRALIALAQGPAPAGPDVFIHRDYQPFNVLWRRGRLTAIVDWALASHGDPGMDAGHCIVNVAALFGVEAADRFRAMYEAASGLDQHPYWDALSLLDMGGDDFCDVPPDASQIHDGGRPDVTPAVLIARNDAYAASIARRL